MTSLSHRVRFRRDHRWAPAHMSAYLDGELTSAARARMERHSGECPDCRGTLEGLRRMLDMLERLPRAGAGAASPKIATAVQRRLHEPPAR